ncbi:MAG TPA: glycosyltransferase [Burkholderiales bacterium]|nr:glycosyltransferase [Burkholderiales bacterium]
MKVFFYVQHLLGIGHLKRAAVLAAALRKAGIDVTLASGGVPVAGIEVDVQLPPASAADLTFRTLLDQARQPVDDDWKRSRAAALLDAWRAARAEVLLVELFPFGRRQMRFELLPLLEDARRLTPRPLVVCSVRDLIQSRPEREAETVSLVERFFDRILVHGDPRLASFERTFAAAARFGKKLQYTGYVVAEMPASREHGSEVLVSAGGGAVGRRLLECAMLAREQTLLRGATWRVLAGVNCAEADYRALERLVRPGIALERSRDDFTVLLGKCALSISQAGYNTVTETLQARVHAVLVPFAGGGESEQGLRAQLLVERGAACVADERTLSPQTLAEAVNRAVRAPLPPAGVVDLNGAARSAELLKRWRR